MQHDNKKKYRKPQLRAIDPALLSREGWNRKQLLQVRDLIVQAIRVAEADDELRDVVAGLRSTLSVLAAELARGEEPAH